MPGKPANKGELSRALTARPFKRPAATIGSTEGGVANVTCVSPAMTDWIAGAPPRNGTRVISTPATWENKAAPRCGALPLPAVAQLITPGDFLAFAIRSWIELIPLAGLDAMTSGELVTLAIGARSRSVYP